MAALAVIVGALVVTAGAAPAGAAAPGPTPADVILSTSLPGFAAAPAGAFNGPISTSTLSTFTHNADLLAEIANGTVSGYLRNWGTTDPSSTGVVSDLVLQFPAPAQVTAFLDELQFVMIGQYGATTFPVEKLSGALGYSATNAIVPGSIDVGVAFGRGDFASFVVAATPGGTVTTPQMELMAAVQWAALPAPTGPTTGPAGVPSTVPAALPPALVPTTLPASALSSSATGGVEALVVLFLLALVIGFLVLLAADAVGRRRHRVLDDGGHEQGPSTAPCRRARPNRPDTPLPYRAAPCPPCPPCPPGSRPLGSLTPAGPADSVRYSPCRHAVAPRPPPRISVSDAASRTSPTPSTRASRRPS